MDIKITLDSKQLYPAVINLKQFSSGTDVLTFLMEDYMYETTDLSKMDAYAVCDMINQEVDEVKLEKQVVEGKLKLTWRVDGYTTQLDGHITYQIVFKDIANEKAILWFSHQGIIFISESHDGDGRIAAKYPTILQQWERRMNSIDNDATEAVGLAQESALQAQQSANQAQQSATNAENQAADASSSASKSEQMKNYIEQLINYEGTNAIEKEVVEARGDFLTLGVRLDDTDSKTTSHESRISFIEENGAASGDTIPVGGIVAYDDGGTGIIPKGWEKVDITSIPRETVSKYVIPMSYQISNTSAYFFIEFPEMLDTPTLVIKDGLTEVIKPDGSTIAVTGHNFSTITKSYAILRVSYAAQSNVPAFVRFAKYIDITAPSKAFLGMEGVF